MWIAERCSAELAFGDQANGGLRVLSLECLREQSGRAPGVRSARKRPREHDQVEGGVSGGDGSESCDVRLRRHAGLHEGMTCGHCGGYLGGAQPGGGLCGRREGRKGDDQREDGNKTTHTVMVLPGAAEWGFPIRKNVNLNKKKT